MGLAHISKKWSDLFCRRPNLKDKRGRFSLKGAKRHLYNYGGYSGGHEESDRILKLMEKNHVQCEKIGWDSFMNVAGYKSLYRFKDGGIAMYSGNYFTGPGRGVFVVGFEALRWLLDQLGVKQPRRFNDELAAEAILEKSSSEEVRELDFSTVQF